MATRQLSSGTAKKAKSETKLLGVVTPPELPRAAPAQVRGDGAGAISDGERAAMIREAAYFRAQRRGFEPGAEVQDWLEAEAEVDGLLRPGAGP